MRYDAHVGVVRSGQARARRVGPALAVSAASCVVPSIDLDGRPCPCVDGWVCNPDTMVCERTGGDGDADDSGGSDGTTVGETTVASGGADTASAPAFDVLAFTADWSTPTSIHWAWDVAGEEADFHAYEVWIATSEAALTAGTDVHVVDDTINPELSRWTLNNTTDIDAVVGTITDGLQPGVEYFARLHVLDTAGGRTSSPNVAVRSTTSAPVSAYVVFADDPPGGLTLPECMARVDSAPAQASTHHYAHVMRCDPELGTSCTTGGAPECWENLRLQNLPGEDLMLGNGEFTDAFVEAWVAIDGVDDAAAHGWWSELGIATGDGSWHVYRGLTLRADGTYRRYEIPLTQLGLTPETFDGIVTGFRVGSTFPDATTVRFDEVRIRW